MKEGHRRLPKVLLFLCYKRNTGRIWLLKTEEMVYNVKEANELDDYKWKKDLNDE